MDKQIIALVAQQNAASYYQRMQRVPPFVLVNQRIEIRAALLNMQERAAHHARIARVAMGVEE